MVVHRDITKEIQCLYGWKLSAISDFLTTGKDILYLEVYIFGIRLGLNFLSPIVMKRLVPASICGSGVSLCEDSVLVKDSSALFQYPLGKSVTTMLVL